MVYKDKDKQREAQRDWVRQKRAVKGSTRQGSTHYDDAYNYSRNPVSLTKIGNVRVSKLGDARLRSTVRDHEGFR